MNRERIGFRAPASVAPEARRIIAAHKAALVDTLAFLAQWRAEVETMRRGDDADCLKWTPACRGRWAAAMLDLAMGEGVPESGITREIEWLGGIQHVPP